MLPMLAKDGRPFLPPWIYTAFGLTALFISYASAGDVKIAVPAIGAILCVMGLAIEVAVIRARVEKLEGENAALRHALHHEPEPGG
jgi:hypothetical protein